MSSYILHIQNCIQNTFGNCRHRTVKYELAFVLPQPPRIQCLIVHYLIMNELNVQKIPKVLEKLCSDSSLFRPTSATLCTIYVSDKIPECVEAAPEKRPPK